jgi:hypothetical protein
MIVSIKRNGCGYDFEVFVKRHTDDTFYQVRHADVTVIQNSDVTDIDHHIDYLARKVLDIIEGK